MRQRKLCQQNRSEVFFNSQHLCGYSVYDYLVIRACSSNQIALGRGRTPADGVDCPKMWISQPSNLFVVRLANFPDDPGLVIATTGQVFSFGVKVKAPDRWGMARHGISTNPFLHGVIVTPTFDSVIIAGWEEQVLLRMPLEILDILSVIVHNTDTWVVAFFVFILFMHPNGLVPATGGNIVALGTPSHTFDLVLMALNDLFWLNVVIIFTLHPDDSSGIKTTAGQRHLILWSMRLPRYRSNCAAVRTF